MCTFSNVRRQHETFTKRISALSVIVTFCGSVMAEEVVVTVKGLVCSFCAQKGLKRRSRNGLMWQKRKSISKKARYTLVEEWKSN